MIRPNGLFVGPVIVRGGPFILRRFMSEGDTKKDSGTGQGQEGGSGQGAGDSDQGGRPRDLSSKEAAYRTQRNTALRRAHAYETMLKHHGVDFSFVSDDNLKETLPIDAGRVDGQFNYKPAKVASAKSGSVRGVSAAPKGGLTRGDLSRMSSDEINKRWDEVKSVLKKGV